MPTVLLALALAAADPVPFTEDDVGKVPAGWAAAKTGTGTGSVWRVTRDTSAATGRTLTQTAAGPGKLFNLCVHERIQFRDGDLSVRVRALEGAIDQGGGLVWRLKDADNYYVCRYNPLEENLRVYKVVAGVRTQLATKEDVTVPAGEWFTVSVKHTGDKIECSLNGAKHLSVTDATFPDAGKVGVWTKADAITSFDRLTVTPAPLNP
jgi:hypothetical protein